MMTCRCGGECELLGFEHGEPTLQCIECGRVVVVSRGAMLELGGRDLSDMEDERYYWEREG